MRTRKNIVVAFSALSAFLLALATSTETASAGPGSGRDLVFRLVCFNIRFDFPTDAQKGDNWAKRHDMIAHLVLQEAKANVVCFQEDKTHQVEDLKKDMPGWQFV